MMDPTDNHFVPLLNIVFAFFEKKQKQNIFSCIYNSFTLKLVSLVVK